MGGRKVFINTPEKFWSFVNKTDKCWFWTKHTVNGGYGRFSLFGKRRYSHHLAYLLSKGLPLDTKLYLCHTCDNPTCVNPSHVYEGSNKTNTLDKMSRGRARGLFEKGSIPANAVIDLKFAQKIKEYLKSSPPSVVARELDVSRYIVKDIKRGKTWKEENSYGR